MPLPETQLHLVIRLSDPSDQLAWGEFLETYAPFLVAFFRRRNLQDADAHDLTQQVLMAVAHKVGDWSPDGRPESFRRWLLTIARHAAIKFWLHADRRPPSTGGTDFLEWLQQQPPARGLEEETAVLEFRQAALRWGLQRARGEVRPSTWEAFWRTCILNEDIEAVARETGQSLGAIYMARSRVMNKLKQHIRQFDIDDAIPPCGGTP